MSEAATPLDQLRDIHLPANVDWWPLAPGWWVLFALVLLVLLLLWRWAQKIRRKALRTKLIMTSVDELASDKSLSGQEWLGALSSLLRQLAINLNGREESAGLVGQQWLAYLDKCGNTSEFSQGAGKVLASSPYQESVEYDRSALIVLTRQWLRTQSKRGGPNA